MIKAPNRPLNRRSTGPLLGSIAALLLWVPTGAFAGSAQWSGTSNGDWNTRNNWNPITVPNGPGDVATFGISSVTGISLSSGTEVNSIVFNSGASSYTLTVPPSNGLTISGVGITNNSGTTQHFVTTVDTGGNGGFINFTNNSSAGVNTVFTNNGASVSGGNGGYIQFDNNSTAGSATFVNNGATVSNLNAVANGGGTAFKTNTTAGNAVFINNPGTVGGTVQTFDITTGAFFSNGANPGGTLFYNTSTAGNASFTNNGGAVSGVSGAGTLFYDNSTAGNGVFVNNGGTAGAATSGVTLFYNSSTAGSGNFTNNGGIGNFNGGATLFQDTSNAGSGTFINNGGVGNNGVGGGTQFYGNSSAGNGTFINNGGTGSGALTANLGLGGLIGGLTLFSGSSTAANATLIANSGAVPGSGGIIAFLLNSSGGTATVKVFGNGYLDISMHAAPGVSIGSIEGTGNVFLGANNLTAGSNNVSTTFDGVIQDGGPGAGAGGSLTKIGAGSLTLNGANTFTGATTVIDGSLIVNGSIASAKTIINTGGALLGRGTIGGDLANNGFVVPGSIPLSSGNVQSVLAASAGKSINLNFSNFPTTQLSLNVKGNYTQNAGGTLVIAYGGSADTQHTSLKVQGQANLGGNLRLVQVNGARLNVGDSVPIVTATGGVVGKFAAVTDAPLINANVVYQSNAVVLETSQGSIQSTLSSVGRFSANDLAVAAALDSAAGDPRAAHLFSVLNSLNINQLVSAVERINPEDMTSISGVANSVSSVHGQNLQLRMAALRAGVTGFSSMGYHTADNPSDYSSGLAGPSGPDGKSGKEVAPPPPDNRWGSFITGAGQFNHVGDTENARGFTLDSGGITLGVDYRFTDHFVAGIFLGYTYTGIDISAGGRITADAGKVGLYSTYFNGGFYVDTAVQGGYTGYESDRAGFNGTAHGSPHGGDFNLLFAPGYNWTFGALTIGPTASFQYSYQGTNGFTETGSDAPMSLSSQHTTSLISTVGMKASYDWKIGSAIIRPEVRLNWQHEYGDVSSTVASRLASGAGDSFQVTGPEIGRDSMLIGAGVSVVWRDRFSTYVYYDGEFFRTNYDSSTITGGFRYTF